MPDISDYSQINERTGIIRKLKTRIYPTLSRYFSHSTLVEGKLKDTDETFRCLFIENTAIIKYILPRMYGQSPVILRKSRIWIPLLKTVLKTYSDTIDMCIAALPTGYDPGVKGLVNFKSDMLIRSFIDTSVGPDRIKKQLRVNKKRFFNKMTKNPAFSCRVSTDAKDFDLFYTKMHVPHVQKRYEDLADLDSYEYMKTFFQKGFLLLIEEGQKAVAGVLCTIENNTLFFRRTGILDGDNDYIKRGASLAQYYFTLKYALDNGIPKVDLMKSRPFFDDGVYVTKREWGAQVYLDNENAVSIFFFIPRISNKIVTFFENNPLIIHKENELYGLVGWKGSHVLSVKDEKTLQNKYYSPGLKGFVIIQPGLENPARIIKSPDDANI